jgi:hypothetical protein
MMDRQCSACKIMLGKTEGPEGQVTHGLCELCALETLEAGNLITPDERKTLATLRFDLAKQRADLSIWFSHRLNQHVAADRFSQFESARRRVIEMGELTHRIVRDEREEYFWVVGRYDAQRLTAVGHVAVNL